MLSVSSAWLARHRCLFEWFRVPGRGATGKEYRFTLASVEGYIKRGIAEAAHGGNPYAGKSIFEITALIKAGVGREQQGGAGRIGQSG
jgi:hypothetical protein